MIPISAALFKRRGDFAAHFLWGCCSCFAFVLRFVIPEIPEFMKNKFICVVGSVAPGRERVCPSLLRSLL